MKEHIIGNLQCCGRVFRISNDLGQIAFGLLAMCRAVPHEWPGYGLRLLVVGWLSSP